MNVHSQRRRKEDPLAHIQDVHQVPTRNVLTNRILCTLKIIA